MLIIIIVDVEEDIDDIPQGVDETDIPDHIRRARAEANDEYVDEPQQ